MENESFLAPFSSESHSFLIIQEKNTQKKFFKDTIFLTFNVFFLFYFDIYRHHNFGSH